MLIVMSPKISYQATDFLSDLCADGNLLAEKISLPTNLTG
jgi:hypothetical protein